MEECVFCKIGSGSMPSKKEYDDEELIVFHDINPSAPVHLLIVPKKHLELGHDLDVEKVNLGKIFEVSKVMAKKMGVFDSGYKLVMNCGRGAGQIVEHIHVHLLGGWRGNDIRDIP